MNMTNMVVCGWKRLAVMAFAVGAVAAPLTCSADQSWNNQKLPTSEVWSKTISIPKGSVYTFILSGLSPESDIYSFYVMGSWLDNGWETDIMATGFGSQISENGSEDQYVALLADDWYGDEPSTVRFTIYVEGWYDASSPAENRTFNVQAVEGNLLPVEVPTVPVGTASNPKKFTPYETATPSRTRGEIADALQEGAEYYLSPSINLVAGRKYFFGVQGLGASSNVFDVVMKSPGSSVNLLGSIGEPYTDVWTSCSNAYSIVVPSTGGYNFVVTGGVSAVAGDTFAFYHAVLPTKKPAEHATTNIAVESATEFTPGYLNNPASGAYDQVIDNTLFAVTNLVKGGHYVFETTGADTNLLLRLYDKNGNILAENKFVAANDFNVRAAWTAPSGYFPTSSGYIFAGVCQQLADEDVDEPSASPAQFRVYQVDLDTSVTPLAVVPENSTNVSPVVAGGAASDARSLGATMWTNTFSIAARKDVTYLVKGVSDDASGLFLNAVAYTLSGTTRRVLASKGSLDPNDGSLGFEFTATAHGPVYIDVSVADGAWGRGAGLDYGPYRLYACARQAGQELGILRVDMMGASPAEKMKWQLKTCNGKGLSGEPWYDYGTSALLPTGTYAVAAQSVSGFATPPSAGFTNVAVVAGKVATETIYKYTDTCDPKDDSADTKAKVPGTSTYYSPTALSVQTRVSEQAHTLWDNDVEDNFKFDVSTAGSYYKLYLRDVTGDAEFSVTNTDGAVVAEGTNLVERWAAPKGKYFLCVRHAAEPAVDGTYALGSVCYSPEALTPATSPATVRKALVAGEYYFKATLAAGREYRFAVGGGTVAKPLTVDLIAPEGADFVRVPAGDAANDAFVLYPYAGGTYVLNVRGADAAQFTLTHSVSKERPVSQHSASNVVVGAEAVEVAPGWVNRPEYAGTYHDGIVDDALFSAKLERGKKYIVETSGAECGLVLFVYDSAGKQLSRNTGNGSGLDVRALVEPTTAGVHYFGVAQDIDELNEVPDPSVRVLFSVREVVAGADDPIPLSPVPGAEGDDPVVLDPVGVGPYALGTNAWTRTFAISARAGLRYRLAATRTEATGQSLAARVYTRSGTSEKAVAANLVSGSLDPGAEGLTVTAAAHDTYFVEVSVAAGKALDYPDFTVHSSAFSPDGAALGVLRADMKGAPADKMKWKLLKRDGKALTSPAEPWYAAGASVLVPGGSAYDVGAQTVQGFAAPPRDGFTNVNVSVGTAATPVVYKYSDTSDSKDDRPSGKSADGKVTYSPTQLSPSAKGVEAVRTLWDDDEADWFKFTGAEGVYYKFLLAALDGAPSVSVYGPDTWTNAPLANVLNDDPHAVQVLVERKGNYFVRVSHADEEHPVDSSYTLVATSANCGAVKFQSTKVSVKEDAAYVELSVSRTAKEGMVRVKFRTEAGVGAGGARPGSEYYPTNGVLTWAAGNQSSQKIRVRLIPDEYARFETNKSFSVVLERFPESMIDTAAGEYLPAISGGDTATVTLTEVSKRSPGTVKVLRGGMLPFADVKKAALSVVAGNAFSLDVVRTTDACDGTVGVLVETVAGTAKAGVDFVTNKQTYVWADLEGGPKVPFSVQTLPSTDAKASKAFTVKVSALSGKAPGGASYERPAVEVASVAVTVLNDGFADTLANWAKGLPKSGGVAAKEGKAGTWFLADDGSLFTTNAGADVTFTLAGPGRFTVTPSGATLSATVGTGASAARYECVAGVPSAIYVGSGNQTVKLVSSACCGLASGLAAQANGLPYLWEPLAAAVAAEPTVDKAVAPAGECELALVREPGVDYRVFVLAANEKGKSAASGYRQALKLGDAETELQPDGGGRYVTNLVAGVKYSWRADSCFLTNGVVAVANTNKTAWTLTAAADTAPRTGVAGFDVLGNPVTSDSGVAIPLYQGVKLDGFCVTNAGWASCKVFSGKLPDGVSLDTKTGKLTGTPTKAGTFGALLQISEKQTIGGRQASVDGTTASVTFEVQPMCGTGAGTFSGLVSTTQTSNGIARIGSVTVTATAAGKLSAKVTLQGKTYTFSDTGYTSYAPAVGGRPATLTAELPLAQKFGSGASAETYTNVLSFTTCDVAETNAVGWTESCPVRIDMLALPDLSGNGHQDGIVYSGVACRDNSKTVAWLDAVADFVGYYTVALVPQLDPALAVLPLHDQVKSEPVGRGYATVTIDAKGGMKVAGQLADGTSYSASSKVSLGTNGVGDVVLRVPLFSWKGKSAFGGWLQLAPDAAHEMPVVTTRGADAELVWNNDDPASTRSGTAGFFQRLLPAGGWYDTLFNLQRHYIDFDFAVDTATADELPSELLPAGGGYAFVAGIGPDGTAAGLTGDVLATDKQSLAKEKDASGRSTTYNDWTASANAANVSLTFKRATGLVNGSFTFWYEGTNSSGKREQKSVTGLKHSGVLVLSSEDDDVPGGNAVLGADVWTSGAFVLPVKVTSTNTVNGRVQTSTRTWNAVYPFNIKAINVGRDWSE